MLMKMLGEGGMSWGMRSLSDSNDSENDDQHNKISSIEDLEERPNKNKKVNKKMNYAVPLQPMH